MKKNVIEMHATWLTINSVIGCTNNCKYCFLQSNNKHVSEPIELTTPKESIQMLLQSKYYINDIPICLLPNTDVFLNNNNTKYLMELLLEIKNNNIKNPLIIITKCGITPKFIDYIKDIAIDEQLIVYISYSGLGKNIEPNVDINKVKENFKLLYDNNIKIIHYFRPLIPENSNVEKIKNVLNYVSKYTKYSVITGLKIKKEYFEQLDFWQELKKNKEECINSDGVWDKAAFDYFYKYYDLNQYIFQTNACALASILNKPKLEYFCTYECNNYNLCSLKQRELCKRNYKSIDYDKLKETIIYNLKKIEKYNSALIINVNKMQNSIVLENIDLEVGDLAFLSFVCHIKITTSNRNKKEKYFNSTLNSAKPFIIGD